MLLGMVNLQLQVETVHRTQKTEFIENDWSDDDGEYVFVKNQVYRNTFLTNYRMVTYVRRLEGIDDPRL